jgi:hypothetical protein
MTSKKCFHLCGFWIWGAITGTWTRQVYDNILILFLIMWRKTIHMYLIPFDNLFSGIIHMLPFKFIHHHPAISVSFQPDTWDCGLCWELFIYGHNAWLSPLSIHGKYC